MLNKGTHNKGTYNKGTHKKNQFVPQGQQVRGWRNTKTNWSNTHCQPKYSENTLAIQLIELCKQIIVKRYEK